MTDPTTQDATESRRVDRLFSRNVSFTSADILTFSEVHNLLTTTKYNNHDNISQYNGKSVRFTGRLITQAKTHTIDNHDRTIMMIQVADPMDVTCIGIGNRNKSKSNPYKMQMQHRSSSSMSSSHHLKNSASASASSGTSMTPGKLPLQHKIVKRPLQSRTFLGKRDIGSTGVGAGIIVNHHRLTDVNVTVNTNMNALSSRSSSSQTQNLTHAPVVAEFVKDHMISVSVDVHAVVPLEDCKVGDLIMVIGEVRILVKDRNDAAASEVGYLEARIVRNCNGVDVQLQEKAFLLRREYLIERFGQSSSLYAESYNPPLTKADSQSKQDEKLDSVSDQVNDDSTGTHKQIDQQIKI